MNLIRTTKTAEAVEIAIANAQSAIDQRHEYTDPVSSYRINVVDTLVETGLLAFHPEALAAYDAHIKANWPQPVQPDSTLAWAVVSESAEQGFQVEGVYYTSEAARQSRDELRRVWPERKFSTQVAFIRNPSL